MTEKRDSQMGEKAQIDYFEQPPLDKNALPATGTQERAIAERNLVRKLDCRLMPTIFLYVLFEMRCLANLISRRIFIMNYIDVGRVIP